MVVRTDICSFCEYRIYPGKGQRYIAKDGRGFLFISKKAKALSLRKIKAQKMTWTVAWRRHNKKIKTDDISKKKKKRVVHIQRAINGITLEDIKKKRSEKPEVKVA